MAEVQQEVVVQGLPPTSASVRQKVWRVDSSDAGDVAGKGTSQAAEADKTTVVKKKEAGRPDKACRCGG
jgi:hypothetical protein